MAFVVEDPTPFLMRNALVRFKNSSTDGFDFEKAVSSIQFVPSSSTATFQGLTPEAGYSFPGSSTWVCNITFAQDWESATSLSRYMFTNEGEEQDIVFEPVAGGQGFEATIILGAPPIGGDVNSVAVATVACGSKGKPTLAV